MTISMYQASVPVFIRMLRNLAAILEKAEAHATAEKIDPAVLLHSRLFPDMFPLVMQVRIAGDGAKGGAARLAQVEVPKFEDTETTFPELGDRIRRTIHFLETLKPEQIDGSEERTVSWMQKNETKSMQGLPYLLHRVIPNFYFHITTAYDILRHNGVDLGKRDFLGKTV